MTSFSKMQIGKLLTRRFPLATVLVMVTTAFYTLSTVAFYAFQNLRHDPFWFRLGFFSSYVSVAMALWVLLARGSTATRFKKIRMTFNLVTLALFLIIAIRLFGSWHQLMEDVTPLWTMALAGLILRLAAEYRGWDRIGRPKPARSAEPVPNGDSLIVRL